jgi:translocation and assembly module TamB
VGQEAKMRERVIAVLLVCMILMAGSAYWFSKSQEVMTGAQNALSTEIANALGSLVTVGEIEVTSYNKVTIHNIAVYDKQLGMLASSEKIIVSYSPWNILTGWNVMKSISELKVEKPTIWLTQRNDGHWNIEDLVIQDNASKSSLSGKVRVADGRAIISAYNSQWTLEELNGSLDLANNPNMELELQGTYQGAPLKGKGTINSKGRSTLSLHADRVMLTDFRMLMPAQGPIKLVGGSTEQIEATIAYEKGKMEWAGEARLVKVDMDLDDMPMRQIDGGMAFTDKNLYVFAAGKVFDQPIDVRGNIYTDASEPILNLNVTSNEFDPSATGYDIPVKGKVAFNASITGIPSNPVITGDIKMPAGELAGYSVKNVQTKLDMIDKNITIQQFKADILGGNVAASGQFQLNTNSYQLALTGQHIDIQNFSDIIPDIRGYVDAEVTVKGIGDLAGAEVQGTAKVGQGDFAGVPFTSVTSGFYYNKGNTTVDYLNIGLGQGMVTAQGAIEAKAIALRVYGSDVPLQLFSQGAGTKVEGIGQFNGEVRGTLSAPEFAADFTAVNGEILSQPFTQVTGNIQGTPMQVTLQNVEMVNGVTKHRIQGSIALSGARELNMAISSKQARAETLVPLLAPGEKLTGNVDNEMVVTGTLANPNIVGHLTLTDGSFRGQLIASAAGSYKREQGVTSITNFVIQSLNTQIQLSGVISPDNDLNFDIAAQNIDLEKLNMNTSNFVAAGKAKFNGKLTGTPTVPIFKGELSADKLSFNQQEITGVTGTIAVAGDEIEIPTLTFSQGKGTFTFYGGINKGTSEIYGVLDVVNGDLQPILAASKVGNKDIVGTLNGQAKISGMLDKPTVRLIANLKAGSVKKYPVESITVDAALENNIVTIYDVSVKQGTGVMLARGRADLNVNGPITMEIGGRGIDAGLVSAFFNTSINPTGKLDFAAQVSGTSDNPHTALSLELVNGGIGDTTFDSLYGLLSLDKNVINVNQILLKKGPHQASAYGVIPVAALSYEGRQQANSAEQMNLNVKLDKANLSILPLLTKQVAWAEGATQGEITITGTLNQPVLNGKITVNNGTLKLAALKDPIQKVGVDIAFEGDTINVKQFEGHMGTGLYRATGTAKLQGLNLADYNVSLVLDNPMIRSKYFTGAVNGNLTITQGNVRPKLAGKLLFENDIIDIPTIPDMQPSDMNMDLDVDIKVGKKVRFYNPYLYDILAVGRVKVGGSIMEPDVSGRIVAIRGTISYLRTQFKVEEGSVEFRQFSSFEPNIKLRAQTRLQQTVVYLNVNGPMGSMEFNLTSEPTMNQQEIISLLTLRSRYFDKQNNGDSSLGRDELMSALDAGLQMRFISEIEGNIRNVLGLDEFRFVRDTTSNIVKKNYNNKDESSTINREVYNLEMSKYLTDKLLVSYTMGVDHNKSEVSLRYSLSRNISLTGSIDDEKRTWLGAEARYRF